MIDGIDESGGHMCASYDKYDHRKEKSFQHWHRFHKLPGVTEAAGMLSNQKSGK